MPVIDTIKQKLIAALNPSFIEVIDESHLHAGHAGAREGGESHFAVTIISDKFAGLSRVNSHKLIYGILSAELENGVHALRINAKA
jgi:BolA protein